ncbi:MAG: ABC transporter ATP-binding protein, partial [Planctomycetota bacterium]
DETLTAYDAALEEADKYVKANTAEGHEVGRLRGILKKLLKFQLRLAKIDAFSTPVLETLGILAIGVVLVVATYFVRVRGDLSPEAAILIFFCLAQMAEALRKVTKLNIILQKANAAAERIFETVDQPKEEPGVGKTLPVLEGEIAFNNLEFAYPGSDDLALRNVSLTVAKGESVAVVGRNGSGKTTLLSLLPRFFEPTGGSITVDGENVADASLQSLRDQIGVVTQEAVVFPGTIAENIAYAKPGASREDIEAAANEAEAHEFILAKGGYDTELTGLGGSLSGGQRQRLNIARAILKDPPILILDEATSQVDAESEHAIQQAIVRLMQGRTVFVIAHRFSTILDCDRIVLMDAGEIVAQGTHDELQQSSELYRQLYERQLVPA